ncbi:MAG: hypothetical protein ACI9ZH_002556 [Paracoccaceae bacterium]|jgi:hypothetical protein
MNASMLTSAALAVGLAGEAAQGRDEECGRLPGDLTYIAEGAAVTADTHGAECPDRGRPGGGVRSAQASVWREVAGALLNHQKIAPSPEITRSADAGLVGGELTLSERGRLRPAPGMAAAWLA